MDTLHEEIFICDQCTNEVRSGDEFCLNCGAIFPEYIQFCWNHPKTEASGVCIICQKPYCLGCAQKLHEIFLCTEHLSYEIYECMARVYAINDESLADFVKERLTQAGMHPCIFHKKNTTSHFGVPGNHFFYPAGNKLMDEFKVMVPCKEVLGAEQTLRNLQLLPERTHNST